jgi:hypothetical protein
MKILSRLLPLWTAGLSGQRERLISSSFDKAVKVLSITVDGNVSMRAHGAGLCFMVGKLHCEPGGEQIDPGRRVFEKYSFARVRRRYGTSKLWSRCTP